jgi:hypothetical protein
MAGMLLEQSYVGDDPSGNLDGSLLTKRNRKKRY